MPRRAAAIRQHKRAPSVSGGSHLGGMRMLGVKRHAIVSIDNTEYGGVVLFAIIVRMI